MGKISIDFKTGELKKNKNTIVGIDLGTTNSLIAYIDNGQAKILPIGKNQSGILPSVLYFKNDTILIGDEAKQLMLDNPENGFYSIKRLMGKTVNEIQNKQGLFTFQIDNLDSDELVRFNIKNKQYTPIDLSSLILKEIKEQAEQILNSKIDQAVITVPAYFTDSQRQATRDAGKLAGLDVLRIINEPTAASMAYGIGLKPDEIKQVMVYDFGGGTFDVSVLRIENGVFEVLSTQGDNFLGGDDLDMKISEYWIAEHKLNPGTHERNELRLLAESVKRELQLKTSAIKKFNHLELKLDRDQFHSLITHYIDKTIASCQLALKDSSLHKEEIDEIILVGGSSRLILVKEKLALAFQRPINDRQNPDEVVALGAAIQADILAGNRKDLLLLDINPLSLGIETIGGLMDTIIPRNSKIPLQLAKNYTTSKDGQRNLKISVFQGERELVENNIKLAEFIFKDLPPMAAGLAKIEVKFAMDADGILSVTAKELRSGLVQQIEVVSPSKLSEAEIARRLKESITFADADMQRRAWIELKNEADYIILNSKKFLLQNQDYLKSEETETIDRAMNKIQHALDSEQKSQLETAITDFNSVTAVIAHRIMDIQLKNSLDGSSIDQI